MGTGAQLRPTKSEFSGEAGAVDAFRAPQVFMMSTRGRQLVKQARDWPLGILGLLL